MHIKKKELMTLVISIVLVLNLPLSAWADFLDLLAYPATLHFGTVLDTFDRNIHPTMKSKDTNAVFLNARSHANSDLKGLADIIWSSDSLPSGTFIAADGIEAGDTRTYSASFTDSAMVKKVLEPGTMLLLGSCLLGLGLFAIKFRK